MIGRTRTGKKAPDGSRRAQVYGWLRQYGIGGGGRKSAYVVWKVFESPRRSMYTKGGWDDVLFAGASNCVPAGTKGRKEESILAKLVPLGPPPPFSPHPPSRTQHDQKESEGGMAWHMTRVTKPSIGHTRAPKPKPNPESDSAKLELFGDAMQKASKRTAPTFARIWVFYLFIFLVFSP